MATKILTLHRDCLVAAGEMHVFVPEHGKVFTGLEEFWDKKRDWLFGYLTYDLKNETETKVFNTPDSESMESNFR
jgi:para-aminobenzoate synthetase component 1